MAALTGLAMPCPTCGGLQAVPVVGHTEGPDGRLVLTVDAKALREHVAACKGKAAPAPATKAPAHAPSRPLPHFVAHGTRSCTMCGTSNAGCMASLNADATACCNACKVGDTHPDPALAADPRG